MGKVKQRKRLHEQMSDSMYVPASDKAKKEKRHREDIQFVDEKLSKKILSEARKQGEELRQESEGFGETSFPPLAKAPPKKVKLGKSTEQDSDSEDEETNKHMFDQFENMDKALMDINEEDEADLRRFMLPAAKERRTLGDLIMDKLAEKKTAMTEMMSDAGAEEEIDETVRQHYIKIGEVLALYRSGKLPKGFKVAPTFPNWQQLIQLTRPEKWTAASMYAATRIFVSNLPKFQFKDFCSVLLLPRIRDDIAEYKRLNFHLFQALFKSVYKPGDFYEGIVLPLCEYGDCSLREATIVAGVIAQNSIPIGYSAAALILISKMQYNGANSIIMRSILNKKYSLPLSAIDAVVEHFMEFMSTDERMPVLWFQCLLTLIQRYKNDLTKQQKTRILKLVAFHNHHEMTPEIRKEIVQSKRCRGDPVPEEDMVS